MPKPIISIDTGGGYSTESNMAANQIGIAAGKKVVQMIISDSTPEWTGTGEQPSTLEKTAIVGLKVLVAVGAAAATIFMPHVCVPIILHHAAASTAAGLVVKGAISGASTAVNEHLTKQFNANYTPDPEKRKEYTDAVTNTTTGFNLTGKVVLSPHAAEVQAVAELVEIAAICLYDSTPEAVNKAIEIKKLL